MESDFIMNVLHLPPLRTPARAIFSRRGMRPESQGNCSSSASRLWATRAATAPVEISRSSAVSL